jgi:cell division septal protein FtsQ
MIRKSQNKNKKKSWKSFFKRLFFWVFLLIFLAVVFWVLLLSDYTELRKIKINSVKIEESSLNEKADNYRDEFYFDRISKNNFFLFPRNSFKKELLDKFEKIRKIILKNNFPDSIIVDIEERETIIVLCNQEKCFLVDETGEAFYEIKKEERDNRFKEYNVLLNKSSFEIQKGFIIADEKIIELASDLNDLLEKEMGINIDRELETPSLISKELRVKTEDSWWIYLNTEIEISEQLELLKEILKSIINEREEEQLEYIDLRIPNKAIYKSALHDESIEDENDDSEMNDGELDKKNN